MFKILHNKQETLTLIAEQLLQQTYYNYPDEHTKDSAKRIADYWNEIMLFSITKLHYKDELVNFENEIEADKYIMDKLLNVTNFEIDTTQIANLDQGLLIGPIRVYAVCSHHYAPMFGNVYIAVNLESKMLGLSKYARIAKLYAKQPLVQEIYTNSLAKLLNLYLEDSNIVVLTKFRHLCMESRGVNVENAETICYAMCGTNEQKKKELFDLIKLHMK